MVKASKGTRTKTRNVIKKKPRARGLSPITLEMQRFDVGQKVNIVIDPSVHKGMPFSRFHGKTGTVLAERGRAYEVAVKEGNKMKMVVARPQHLKKNVL